MTTANANLQFARETRDDEFYTQLGDVESELRYFEDAFRGKVVYCNADDPHWSAFPRYFLTNFRRLGLKRLVSTCFNGEAGEGETPDLFAEPTGRKAWKLDVDDFEGGLDEFVKANAVELEGNGSFWNRECLALLREADIVSTNPPFSHFRRFFRLLRSEKKDFLILGHVTAITLSGIFDSLKAGEFRISSFNRSMVFLRPDGKKGEKIQTGWFTTLKDSRPPLPPLSLSWNYSPERYARFDEYPEAININRTSEIPKDFYGIMGVPISFLERYSPEQFELLGMDSPDGEGKGHGLSIGGEAVFRRIFIRRRA